MTEVYFLIEFLNPHASGRSALCFKTMVNFEFSYNFFAINLNEIRERPYFPDISDKTYKTDTESIENFESRDLEGFEKFIDYLIDRGPDAGVGGKLQNSF